MSVPDFADVRDSKQQFERAAVLRQVDFNFAGEGGPERLRGASVSVQWFAVFGAKPLFGRVFTVDEDQPHANKVVVISYAAWQRMFGGDAGILERTILLNDEAYRIVGVMGPDFQWPKTVDLWTPLALLKEAYSEDNRFNEWLLAVARRQPGVSLAEANAWLEILADRVRNNGTRRGEYAKNASWGMFALPLTDFVLGDTKTPMLTLLGAVGFVLLIACSNIAGLMLARGSGRAKQVAIQAALGAGRGTLIRQSMVESLLLSFVGGLSGVATALGGVHIMLRLAPERMSAGMTIPIDGSVLLFSAAITLLSALLFGLAPAWEASRIHPHEALKEGGRSVTTTRARQRAQSVLVAGEVALALVLLVGAGLLLRSLVHLQQEETGFDSDGVMTANVSLPASRYQQPERQAGFYRAVLDRLSATPGVTAAGSGFPLPFSGSNSSASFQIEGREAPPGYPSPHGDVRRVSPAYFAALRIPLLSGRVFTDQDRLGNEPVAVIDKNLAEQYWPNEDPLGQRITRGGESWARIIGVVGHVNHSDLAADSGKGVYYYPIHQEPLRLATLVVRTNGDLSGIAGSIEKAVHAEDPTIALHQLFSLDQLVLNSLATRRFVVAVLGFFAALALFMAAIGLYGVISYSVTQRTQEIGVRVALGAQQEQVLRLVVGQGLRLAAIGAAVGFAAAFSLSNLLAAQLFEVSAFDPLTALVTAAALLGAALLASYIPARRAAKVDPIVALRYE